MAVAVRVRGRRGWTTRTLEPFKQGSLDGLCGVYAILNATRLLRPEIALDNKEATELFRKLLVKKLEKRSRTPQRVASRVIDGVTSKTLVKLINMATRDEAFTRGRTLVKQKSRKKKIDAITREMKTKIDEGFTVICGVSGCVDHWTVINRCTGKRFTTFDSGHVGAIPLDKIKGGHSGRDDGFYHIHPSDVFYLKMQG